MDLLARARALAACPLFGGLAPAVVVRLAERARVVELARGDRRTTDDDVWVVATGSLAIAVRDAGSPTSRTATTGTALGVIRIVRRDTPAIEVVAEQPSTLVGLGADDVRDVLEEDPAALAALTDRLAAQLLS
jgi:CRP-like cAMP-binding protein